MSEFKKILIPTDYSELSGAAIEYAMVFSRMFGARIHLLHVLDTIPVLAMQTMDLTTEAVMSETDRNAKNDLHLFIVSKVGNIPGLVEVVRKGIAETEIVRFAKEEGIDLIVMATHGRSGLSHVFTGSVAEKVIQQSPVPVLVINPTRMRQEMPSGGTVCENDELAWKQ
ncbi:MAG TPA: universal stress protein [Bacteroidota bacterium]|nr:universal stress protein [Bacteroidota bacterium]